MCCYAVTLKNTQSTYNRESLNFFNESVKILCTYQQKFTLQLIFIDIFFIVLKIIKRGPKVCFKL